MINHTSKEEHADMDTLCWAIWSARINLVWNQKKSSVNVVVTSIKQYLADWMKAQI